MLIQFFPNGKGAGAGPVGYLIATTVLAYDDNRICAVMTMAVRRL